MVDTYGTCEYGGVSIPCTGAGLARFHEWTVNFPGPVTGDVIHFNNIMTIDPIAYAASLVGSIVIGVFLNWFANYSRLHQSNAKFKYENTDLKKRLFDSQGIVLELQKRETERQEEDARQRNYGRDEQQVSILKILDPHEGKRLCDIAIQCELSEKATVFHLQSLSDDRLVGSPDYGGSPELKSPFYNPSHSTWRIEHLGLKYLANNNLLI